ncbi:hypothetical protein OE88DRAFT_1501430 [Heliocybe sulcata]|uniref:Uncharacterized protein n=1 Tax=Heliocybe sulcata TaxID=5364 RepID=A0A5C3N7P8_9AGAM|nr:hypothetical protein OE88DRAFT_1501430 [Heliocybe sulcata]
MHRIEILVLMGMHTRAISMHVDYHHVVAVWHASHRGRSCIPWNMHTPSAQHVPMSASSVRRFKVSPGSANLWSESSCYPSSLTCYFRLTRHIRSVQNLRQQADIDSVDVDVDNFRLRGALRPVYPPSSLEEVLAYSFSCALEGILRVVQLVLSFAIFGYSGVNVLVVILLMFFIVIEIVVCFKDIVRISYLLSVIA